MTLSHPAPSGAAEPTSTNPTVRPLHRRPRLVFIVGLGGALGTAVRSAVAAVLPAGGAGWPWATWTVNLTGAFALGLLLEWLARTGPDDGRRRDARLLAGTGFLGGYTTYSTLALDAVMLGTDAMPTAVLYATSTLVLGLVAAGGGMLAGARLRHSGGVGHPAESLSTGRAP